jgi:hypothetical protein
MKDREMGAKQRKKVKENVGSLWLVVKRKGK